jgi:hypothetical protein
VTGVDVRRRFPVEAVAARRRAKAHRLVLELAARLDEVSDEHLDRLAQVVAEELYRRERAR